MVFPPSLHLYALLVVCFKCMQIDLLLNYLLCMWDRCTVTSLQCVVVTMFGLWDTTQLFILSVDMFQNCVEWLARYAGDQSTTVLLLV